MPKYLYRYEVKGIQSWIMATSKLRELAGGSEAIEFLARKAKKDVRSANGTLHQAAAGTGTASFDKKEDLAAFAREWPRTVHQYAPGLTVVQAWVALEDHPEETKEKQEADQKSIRELFRRIRSVRNQPHADLPEVGPWVVRAGRSGLPALNGKNKAYNYEVPGGEKRVDRATVAKERAFQSLAPGRKGTPRILKRKVGDTCFRFLNIEKWPEEPVAVIHADGSKIGSLIVGSKFSPKELGTFSTAMNTATHKATETALKAILAYDSKQRPFVRARIIVLGGDDLTVIVPESHAFEFATTWLEAFEEETESRKDEICKHFNVRKSENEPKRDKLTAGMGIAVVHRKSPFSHANELAESLSKRVKSAAKNAEESGFAMLRVTTAMGEESDHTATAWYRSEFASLERALRTIKASPTKPLRQWLSAYERSATDADAIWKRMAEVRSARDAHDWAEFEKSLDTLEINSSSGFWQSGDTDLQRRTDGSPMRDLLAMSRMTLDQHAAGPNTSSSEASE